MKKISVLFYVEYLYYFPHILPIVDVLTRHNHDVGLVLNSSNSDELKRVAERKYIKYFTGQEHLEAQNIDYIFFLNLFKTIKTIKTKKIFMDHGVGTKYCDYGQALIDYDIVLVEGTYRYTFLSKQYSDYKDKLYKVGFTKLDSVINFRDDEKKIYSRKYNLSKKRKTILYSPTFYPSSIEKMSDTFPANLAEYNIIVKPHYFSLKLAKYKKQREKLEKWGSHNNCTICDFDEYSLVPFLSICDLMITDESSAIFEFAALDKPVVINRFLKLRLSYLVNPGKIKKRLDPNIEIYRAIGDNVHNYSKMIQAVHDNINHREKYHKERQKFTEEICGIVDGKASDRIVKLLIEKA